MKKKLFLAGAALVMAVAAVTGYAIYNAAPSSLLDANIEALTQNEETGAFWQSMAYCHGEIRMVCSCKQYAYGCSIGYCNVEC